MQGPIPKGLQITFPVGEDEISSVQVQLSAWSGMEIYRVNGGEVLRVRSQADRTVQSFEAGEKEKHSVEFRAWIEAGCIAGSVFVDGLLYRSDLFDEVRVRYFRTRRLRQTAASVAALTLIAALAAATTLLS